MIKLPEDAVVISKEELKKYIVTRMIVLSHIKAEIENDLDNIDEEIDNEIEKLNDLGIKLIGE